MLNIADTALVIIDIQGKLAQLMHEKQNLFRNVSILIESAKILDIPILWCQQVPEALGPTVEQIACLLDDRQPINKSSFSCCDCEEFTNKLENLGRKQLLLTGIEAHICIYQTAMQLKAQNCQPYIIADAVSSRTLENKNIALNRLNSENVKIASTEMALFELLRTADHPKFKQIAKLVK
jgi:isochorismate hydrolase